MLPYNNPEDIWEVYRADWERTGARLHLERLARQARKAASDGVSMQPRAGGRGLIRSIRIGVRNWLSPLVSRSSAAPCCECCA